MDVEVNVINQKMRIPTNYKKFSSGSRGFIRFIFNFTDDWDDMLVFAQFNQNGIIYNRYLDDDMAVCIPDGISCGKITMVLCGKKDSNTIATSNSVTLFIEDNGLV